VKLAVDRVQVGVKVELMEEIFVAGLEATSTGRKGAVEREGTQLEVPVLALGRPPFKLSIDRRPLTRRRHQLPPQPKAWFRNLVDCLQDTVTIRVLSKQGRPVAGILTLSFKSTLVFKYGSSDARFNNLGGMLLLFWKAIQEEKRQGAKEFWPIGPR
jgi:hypothetical protein